jgi:hypothetical protein
MLENLAASTQWLSYAVDPGRGCLDRIATLEPTRFCLGRLRSCLDHRFALGPVGLKMDQKSQFWFRFVSAPMLSVLQKICSQLVEVLPGSFCLSSSINRRHEDVHLRGRCHIGCGHQIWSRVKPAVRKSSVQSRSQAYCTKLHGFQRSFMILNCL